jgi:signal transduction histidine kinase
VLAIATTALAVIALNPARRRVVAWADRRVYGTRTEPAEMMAGVAAELAAYRSPEDGVNGLAAAARRATRARGAVVRIELPDGPDHEVRAGDVSAAGARTIVSMRVDGAAVGSITVVDPSRHSEGLRLLSRLAALAAPAAADMRTIAELRQLRSRIEDGNLELAASQSRLACAEEQERAHLRQTVQSEVLPAVLDMQAALPPLAAIHAGDVDLDDAARQARELADIIRGLAHDVLPAVLADRGLAAGLRAYVRRLGADVTLTVPESHRLPEPMEAALYICGRLLLDATTTNAGPVAVTLAVNRHTVQLSATASTAIDDVGNKRREHTLRLLADRLSVLGGNLTTTSFDRVTHIRCIVPVEPDHRLDMVRQEVRVGDGSGWYVATPQTAAPPS